LGRFFKATKRKARHISANIADFCLKIRPSRRILENRH